MTYQPTYYSILPASVRYDERLSDSEKIFYSEISALSNKYGYAIAKNSYFAKLYNVSKVTVSRRINKLRECGYINIDMLYDGKQIIERRIYLSETQTQKTSDPIIKSDMSINKIDNTPIIRNDNTPINKTDNTPIIRNDKDNNTRSNNIKYNTIKYNNSSYDHEFQEVANIWQNLGFGMLTERSTEMLIDWLKLHDKYLIVTVLKYAHDKNVKNASYVSKILKNLRDRNVKTAEAFIAENKSFMQNRYTSNQSNQKFIKSENDIPEEVFEDDEDIDF